MLTSDRRTFLRGLAATAAGFTGLGRAAAAGLLDDPGPDTYGNLIADPRGIVDLPPGFQYRIISRWGEEMTDGLLVPGLHDGMAAFDGGPGRVVLVRNHEIGIDADPTLGPYGPKLERLDRIDPSLLYDRGRNGGPVPGGRYRGLRPPPARAFATSCPSPAPVAMCRRSDALELLDHLQEWTAGDRCAVDHGWCFEVPASSRPS